MVYGTEERPKDPKPDLVARVTLDAAATRPRMSGYRCVCVASDAIDRKPLQGFDALFLIREALNPGETGEVGVSFLTPQGAEAMREAGRFLLWEGRVIGEAVVIPGPNHGIDETADCVDPVPGR